MRKKGIVERLVIGAPSENDFSYEKLPKNRKKLFFLLFPVFIESNAHPRHLSACRSVRSNPQPDRVS